MKHELIARNVAANRFDEAFTNKYNETAMKQSVSKMLAKRYYVNFVHARYLADLATK